MENTDAETSNGPLRFRVLGTPVKMKELKNDTLAKVLLEKQTSRVPLSFTQDEWILFKVDQLRIDHYIASGGCFFRPLARRVEYELWRTTNSDPPGEKEKRRTRKSNVVWTSQENVVASRWQVSG